MQQLPLPALVLATIGVVLTSSQPSHCVEWACSFEVDAVAPAPGMVLMSAHRCAAARFLDHPLRGPPSNLHVTT